MRSLLEVSLFFGIHSALAIEVMGIVPAFEEA